MEATERRGVVQAMWGRDELVVVHAARWLESLRFSLFAVWEGTRARLPCAPCPKNPAALLTLARMTLLPPSPRR